jgi:hypothetical protein
MTVNGCFSQPQGGGGEPNSDEGFKPDSTQKLLSKLYTVMVLAPIDTCRILQ